MKKPAIFTIIGTSVLAMAAFFASRAGKSGNALGTATTADGKVVVIAPTHFTTTSSQGVPAYFCTTVQYTLFTCTVRARQVYFR